MLKKTSMILSLCSFFMGFQAHASLDETLRNVDFDAICNGEGGSPEVGGRVAAHIQKIIFSSGPSIKGLVIDLEEKGKGNKAAEKLIEKLLEERKALDEINLEMIKNLDKYCEDPRKP